jgi:hypothetical protein
MWAMKYIGVGSTTTTTQIILYINWCTTLFTLVIHSVRACLSATLGPWRFSFCCRLHWSKSSYYLQRLPRISLLMSWGEPVIETALNNSCVITIVGYHGNSVYHENPLLKTLLVREENRRLKRNWPIDLIWGIEDSPLDDSPSRHRNNHNISL